MLSLYFTTHLNPYQSNLTVDHNSFLDHECFDLFGVFFSGHMDLRRILTDYGFTGYPLKKDFPVVGYVEVVYDEELENVIYVKTSLVQSKRDFFYESLWK